jgi:acetate kinase
MSGHVLILNAGSSSLKFRVYELSDGAADGWNVAAGGQIEGIGTAPRLHAKDGAGKAIADEQLAGKSDARAALDALAKWLRSRFGAKGLVGVGHRVVHGGASYAAPVIVTARVLDDLRALEPLAPLHQPYNLAGIAQLLERLPDVPQVACFDTGFHRGWSDVAELVPVPAEIRRAGVQRYGFHGISYEYIAGALPSVAPEIASSRVIVAHLGSGASLCALKNGKSVDCTFGFTALDGLCMGTRPGALDPGVVLHLFQALELSAKEVETMLYKKCGLLGISGFSNDMRELLASSDRAAQLAVDYFVYRAAKEIGALAAVLGGIDALVFTAGIGERSAEIRRRISAASEWLGLGLDDAANEANKTRISTPASRVSVWAIPTNEELVIAQHARALLKLASTRAAGGK